MPATSVIGLDVGSTSIRAVEVARGKEGPAVVNSGLVPVPYGAVQGGVVADGDVVTGALRRLWAETKFRSKQVVLGVTNQQVVVREMTVLNVPGTEMRKSLAFQVADALPLPPDKSLLDFIPLEDPGKNPHVRGLLVAAPKDAVIELVRSIERAGLQVARVDLASFALLRSASFLDNQVEALVDIGAHSLNVIIHQDGQPLIVRTVPRGGYEITEMISTRLGATIEEAESLKCRVGLQPNEGPETAEVIREGVRPLINEIRSSLAYLSSGERSARVARLALSGGGAMLPGLVETLHTQLGVETVHADPLVRLRNVPAGRHDNLVAFRPSAAVSVGLALGAA